MELNKIKEELNKLCDGTNFSLSNLKKEKGNLSIDLYHDNECNEGLHHEMEFKYPKNKLDFYSSFKDEIESIFYNYNVNDEVELWLEAKNAGFGGVPNARELVENCEQIEEDLKEFTNKVRDSYKKLCNEEEFVND